MKQGLCSTGPWAGFLRYATASCLVLGTLAGCACPVLAGWRAIALPDCFGTQFDTDFLVDSNGDLWIAVFDAGAAAYDGVHCRHYGFVESGETDVTAMLEDHAGTTWFATWDGLFSYDGERWINHGGPLVHSEDFYLGRMCEDSSARLWFGTNGAGVYCYDGEAWSNYTTDDGLADDYVMAVCQDRHGNVWFGTSRWVSRYDGSAWFAYTAADGLPGNYVMDIKEDSSGNLWFATNLGVTRFDGTAWTTFGVGDGLPSGWTRTVFGDRSGRLWVGTGAGVCCYDGAAWKVFTTRDGLLDDNVVQIGQDPLGNIIVGTAEGLNVYDGVDWATYAEADGLASDNVSDVLCAADGVLWFGTYGGGVSSFDGAHWSTYTEADGLVSNLVNGLYQDRSGALWFATDGGACSLAGGTWTAYQGTGVTNCIHEDRAGRLWFGTRYSGVVCCGAQSCTTYTTADGLVNNQVTGITEDASGAMWFGTKGGGISRYDGAGWTAYTWEDGLPGNSVNGLMIDRSGTIWAALNGGVARFDGVSWAACNETDGLIGYIAEDLLQDGLGCVWAAGDEGVTRFDGSNWGMYGMADGLPSHDVVAIAEDSLGALWFATRAGVARHEADRVPPRPVLVSQVPGVSSSRTQDIMFAPSYAEYDWLKYSWSFDGSPWSQWTRENSWFYTGLSDGEHTFKVRALDKIGNASLAPVICAFEVDATAPAPAISGYRGHVHEHDEDGAGGAGGVVRGEVEIVGMVADSRFSKYRLEVRKAGDESWDLLVESESPVANGVLGDWNTLAVPDGEYEVRLSEIDTLGLTGAALDRQIVDNSAPWADETAPAVVTTATGGSVYTAGGEVHLYFPPRAFARDTEVRIDFVEPADLPASLPADAWLVFAGHDISWGDGELLKAATLDMDCALPDTCGAAWPAVYRCGPDSVWQRVGGTVGEGGKRISCSITEAGRYAVYAEAGVVSGPLSLSNLVVTPRVFSPRGDFAAEEAAISFTLGGSGPVTVKIYNRAGRLVREVASSRQPTAGANLVRWDGRDASSNQVEDGLYLVVVEALGQKQVKSLVVVR